MIFTTARVLLHSGSLESFEDNTNDGKFHNYGVQAYSALKAHKTIDVNYPGENAEEIIIPYHAVLLWSVTKEEDEYTKPEDAFCKPVECLTAPICGGEGGDGITLVDGTYTFEAVGAEATGEYEFELSKCYAPTNVTVTIDGATATLPKFGDETYPKYGEWDDNDKPVFTTYPAAVQFWNDVHKILYVAVPTAGEHTVKFTVPSGSEVECGGD